MFVLACCFIVSAIIRAGDVVAALPGEDGAASASADPRTGAAAVADAASGKSPQSLIEEIRRQREVLDDRSERLESREQQLKALESKLRQRLVEIREAKARLEDTAAIVDDAANKDIRRLADMYQQMKPKQAGQIFNEMAPSFAAGFIAEMRPDAAALVLANMAADKAYAVSLLIAGRNIRPDPTVDQEIQ